ncbi:MAG: efflux RND transporter permease subunit [Opitutaceae bacterium]
MSQTPQHGSRSTGTIAWMARNPIAANLVMIFLLAGGFWTAINVQKEVFPEFQLDVVSIGVGYPGAAPTEVEQGILLPIEEAIRSVEGIREVSSYAREGSGSVSIELISGANRFKVLQDVDQAVNRIRTFPDDVEQPEVSIRERRREVLEVVLYGPMDRWALRQLAEQLRDRLRANDNITQVDLGRAPDYTTHIEISRDTLREYGLTLAQISSIIESSSEDVAAGSVETETGEILLRMNERKQLAQDFAEIELIAGSGGSTVRLGDIATIRDGFEAGRFPSQFDGELSVELNIYRVGNESPLDIAKAVETEMADFEAVFPPGVKWRIDGNAADEFRQRVSLVTENGLLAIVIVLVILSLFLELRLAFWVMMGMVISFFGGILFLPAVDISINMISLFGFLIVLGIVVDDAVVVGENVFETRQTESDSEEAAIKGTREVAGPVVFSILSNIVAFIPLMLLPGSTGKFWGPLPYVVVIILAVSLFEALYILPAHLAHSSRRVPKNIIGRKIREVRLVFTGWFMHVVETKYGPFLKQVLRYRYITATAGVALFMIAGSYATSSHMGMILMPAVAADEIEAGIRLPVGTTPEQAALIAKEVTDASLRLFKEQGLETTAEGVKTNVRGGSRFVDVEFVMLPPDERELTADEVIELWRKEIGDITGVSQIAFEAEAGPGGARPDISIDISHEDIDVLEKVTLALVARAEEFSNTRDISDDFNKGKDQFDFKLLPEGRALGLTSEAVGRQLRGAFFGDVALRMLRGIDEVEVRVKLPDAERKNLYSLENLIIQTPSGTEVPLLDVVAFERTEAFSTINRRDGRRVVNVSMDVDPKRAVGQVIQAMQNEELPSLRADYPGLNWSFEGGNAELRESTQTLWTGFTFALAIIYGLLAIAFRSYVQPFIVLIAIPFGIVGAVLGHILLGYDLSLISLMGVLALSGVVVNDSLIMVDYANRRTREGMSKADAIYQASIRRFRPILLTTLTTFGGLAPIIFEKSIQAQYLIPMAISLGFGIVFATGIILLLVPSFYLVLEDIKALIAGPKAEGSKG